MKYFMMILVIILCLVVLTACIGGSYHKAEISDSEQTVTQQGESFTYVVFRLEFLQQIKDLCTEQLATIPFPTPEERESAIAECTFDKLALLNIDLGAVNDFKDTYCGPDADLTQFTPEQIQDILAACAVI